jgi:hypothetical protein
MITILVAAAAFSAPSGFSAASAGLYLNGSLVRAGSGTITALRTVQVGKSARTAFWSENGAPYYAISLDGETVGKVGPQGATLEFQYASFDPLVSVPDVPASLSAAQGSGMYIVQFKTLPIEAYRKVIEAVGGTLYNYAEQNAYLVRLPDSAKARVEGLPYVRWVGPYQPAYRLDPGLIAGLVNHALPVQRYNILVFESGNGQKDAVARRIEGFGGTVVDKTPAGHLMEATLDAEQLRKTAALDEVMWIDKWAGPLEPDMDIARQFHGMNDLENNAGYTGQGVVGMMRDTGVRRTHRDFQSRPLTIISNTADTFHGTSTTGIVFGDGTANHQGRGVLPSAQGVFLAGLNTGATRFQQTDDAINEYGIVFESNSLGSPRTTQYTSISANMDDIVFSLDLLICQSQSNSGSTQSRPEAWAKNIVSVGGINHENTLTPDDDWWGGASTGPASDGRIKPDLSSFYDWIFCPSDSSDSSYTNNFGGTSGATPIVCGSFGLLFEMWADGVFYNTVLEDSVFGAHCHAATAKALMINDAMQYDFAGATDNLSRVHQGWGIPNVNNTYGRAPGNLVVDETDPVAPLGQNSYRVYVPAGQALRATMVYKDPPGNPANQSQHRVNDLTLKATAPDGTTVYYGNHDMQQGVWTTPGGSPDIKDTVENVFVLNAQPGVWTIQVLGSEIVQDTHFGTPQMDADYGLVVTGVLSVIPVGSTSIESGVVVSGGGSDLKTSNNQRFTLRPGAVFSSGSYPIRLISEFDLPIANPQSLDITLESSTSTAGIRQRVEIFDNSNGTWHSLDSRMSGTSDAAVTVHVASPANYIDGSGAVKIRSSWRAETATFIYPWHARPDQLRLVMNP